VNKDKYNDQTIIQYLLGSLPEEEAERVEELSFIDDEFADRLSAVENDLIDNYVSGRLSQEKLERFASYYLASPTRRKKVKTAQVFQVYAENAVATGQVVLASGPSQTIARSNRSLLLLNFLPFNLPRLVLTAAAVLLLVGGGWLLFELSRLRRQIDQAEAARLSLAQRERELQELLEKQRIANSSVESELERVRKEKEQLERQLALEKQIAGSPLPGLNIATFRLTAQSRTGNQLSITVPPGTDYLALQVELEPDDYPSYKAVLLTQPDKYPVAWRSERLKSKVLGDSKVLEIVIPATLLKSGAYLLKVAGISDRGSAEGERGYPFSVVKR